MSLPFLTAIDYKRVREEQEKRNAPFAYLIEKLLERLDANSVDKKTVEKLKEQISKNEKKKLP